MYDLFNMLLDSDIGLWFSFFVASLSGFGIRVMVASQNEFGSLHSSAIFWKRLSKNIALSFNIQARKLQRKINSQTHSMRPPSP